MLARQGDRVVDVRRQGRNRVRATRRGLRYQEEVGIRTEQGVSGVHPPAATAGSVTRKRLVAEAEVMGTGRLARAQSMRTRRKPPLPDGGGGPGARPDQEQERAPRD